MDVGTAATIWVAAATSLTGFIAWRTWRQQQADREPVVEVRPYWEADGSLTARITVRNRLDESLVVERVRVEHPHGARLTTEQTYEPGGSTVGFVRATTAEVRVDRNVAPAGTQPGTSTGGYQFEGTSATETIMVNVQLPESWPGGWLRIALRIASVSRRGRPRWVSRQQRISRPRAAEGGARP